MHRTRLFAAVLAVALALPAAAQGRARRTPAPQPAPAPPAAQSQPQTAGQPAPAPGQERLNDQQRAALGAVWARNKLAIQAGDLAATRGASQEVKSLGRRFADEHRRVEPELTTFVGERGGDVNALPSTPDRQRMESELAQLSSRSGEDFDREFIAYATRNGPRFVDDLKHARDVTPGKDAAFKQWLDAFENRQEDDLTAARQLKAQRQARKPPAR